MTRKQTRALGTLLTLGLASLALTSCKHYDYNLIVYNWEDYIDEGTDELGNIEYDGTITQFQDWFYEETGKTIYVDYETFSTNEDMYNQMKNGAISPDVCCPSDYMIQKMYKEGMLEEFDYNKSTKKYGDILANYETYGSPYIKKLFEDNNFSSYAIPYFWGTMGYIYDPEYVDDADTTTWGLQHNTKYKGKIAIKDSIRDTYATEILYVNSDDVNKIHEDYNKGLINSKEFNNKLTEVFNRCDNSTLDKVEKDLISLKSNLYGLEVDDGKNEIVKGTYYIDVAWSGDAVYALDQAEESEKYLKYSVPEEGSNVWYDGWCMPKGAQKDLAQAFINFLCDPAIAAGNMDASGYTSPIVGEEIWDLVLDWYECDPTEGDCDLVDLSFYFGDSVPDATINIFKEERGRQFDAQYPEEEVLKRCCIMKDFGSQTQALDQMWIKFKAAL